MNSLYHSHDTDPDEAEEECHEHQYDPEAYEGGDHHDQNNYNKKGEGIQDELEKLYGGEKWGYLKLSTGLKAYISFLTLFKLLPMAKKTNRKLRMIMNKIARGNNKIQK